jgi:hypothetical protein
MRVVVWLVAILALISVGCATRSQQPPTYAKLLAPNATEQPADAMLRPPSVQCRQQIRQHVSGSTRILPSPLDTDLRSRLSLILRHLHPAARRVLARTHGIWPVENLKGASAIFVPCDMNAEQGRGGFILVDLGAFPLDRELRDAAVPALYWRTLAGATERPFQPRESSTLDVHSATPTDHAIRYLILHELGHALSLYAGEFDLDARGKIRITRMDGFTGFSWEFVTTEGSMLPQSPNDQLVRSVIPRVALDTVQWGSVLSVIDGEAAMIAPGYQLEGRQDPMTRTLYVCAAAANLPVAGFVTPTAARYPTEDFAEMFAHAILSDEGKIHPTGRVPIELPLCEIKSLPSPYFSEFVQPKRRYIERALGIDARP